MREIWQKRLKRAALCAGLGLSLLAATALLVFVSPLGRDLVASNIVKAIAGDGTARYEAASGAWPGTLVLSKLTLADADGPWLTLEHATLEWRPLALLGGKLAIMRLALDKPVLLRRPKPGKTPVSSGGFNMEPPIAIAIDALSVSDGVLQGGVPIRFDGTGAFNWTRKKIALRTAITRRAGPDEHVILDAGIDPATRRVTLALDAASVPDGLFARLSGMADLPAFRMTASGAGPPNAWAFKAAGSVGDYGALDLGGRLAWTQDIVLDLGGTLSPGAALGPDWREALGKSLALKAHLARIKETGSARVTVEGATVEAGLDTQLGAGSLSGARTLQGTLRVRTSKPLSFGASAAAGPVRLDATLAGTLDRPKAALTFVIEGARYHRYQIAQFDGTVQIEAPARGTLAIGGKGGIGALAARGTKVMEAARWSFGALKDEDAIRDARLNVTSTPLTLDATGGLDAARGALSLDANVTAADLNAIAPIAHVRLAGQATLALTLRRSKRDEDAEATLKGMVKQGAVAGQALAPLGEVLRIDAALTRHPDGTLTMATGQITGDRLAASMSGRIEPTLDLPITLMTDLSALGAVAGIEASGKAEARLRARGTLDDPKLALELTSRAAMLEGRDIGTLTINFVPDEKEPIPSGRLRLAAKGPPGGLDVALPVAQDQAGLLALGPVSGAAYGARLSGALHETREAWAGRLDAAFADLSGAYSLAGGTPQRMAGRGNASLLLGPAADISMTLNLRDVMAESRKLAAAKFSFSASRKGGMARLALNAQELRLPGAVGTIEARRLALQGSGPSERVGWTLTAEGFTTPQGTLDARGTVTSKSGSRELALDALSGTLWAAPVALEAPSRLTLKWGVTQLSPLALKLGTGRIQLAYSAEGRGRKGDLALSAVPVAFVGRIVGGDWPQGRITGQAGLDTRAAHPSGSADLRFSDALFSRQGKGAAEPLSGQLTARWDGRTLSVKGEADRLSRAGTQATQPILLDARLPLIRKGNGEIDLDPRGPLSGEVHWTGRLGTLWALLPYDLHRLDGEAVMDGRASGRWGAPRLEGSLRVEHGRYESLMTGTRLMDIVLSVDAGPAGGEARIEGDDGRGGRFSGRGHLDFGEAQTIKADVSLSNLRVVGLDRLTAEASGPLALTGSMKAPLLAGKLRIDHADGTIPDRLPPSIPQLTVRYVDETDAMAPQFVAQDAGTNAALALALDVEIPGQAFLRGRGLTSEWRGQVKVEGTSLLPRLTGQAELVRGQIAFGGRSYDVSRGRVSFDGRVPIDPALDIAATRSVEGTEIALALSGPSSAPRLDLTSSPALPRDQAMSLFLFGKPAQSLTTLELLDVARSVASLTGTTGGVFDPIEETRRALGLDILTVGVGSGTAANGTPENLASSASVQAGRYVSKRVYLGVKQGARAGSSAVQLNYELTPHLSAGTEVGVESGGQVSVDWKWDY